MAIDENIIRFESKRYGELLIAQDQVYHFPKRIVGFSNISQYALLPFDNSELYVLQSLSEEISFILVPATVARENYVFGIDGETASLLKLQSKEDVIVFFIVNMVNDVAYINPKAPILLVPSSRKGCQYIINDISVPVREPLLREGTE